MGKSPLQANNRAPYLKFEMASKRRDINCLITCMLRRTVSTYRPVSTPCGLTNASPLMLSAHPNVPVNQPSRENSTRANRSMRAARLHSVRAQFHFARRMGTTDVPNLKGTHPNPLSPIRPNVKLTLDPIQLGTILPSPVWRTE